MKTAKEILLQDLRDTYGVSSDSFETVSIDRAIKVMESYAEQFKTGITLTPYDVNTGVPADKFVLLQIQNFKEPNINTYIVIKSSAGPAYTPDWKWISWMVLPDPVEPKTQEG